MLTTDQIANASIDEIMHDARNLPAFKMFRISGENSYYGEKNKWYVHIEAVHDGMTVQYNKFSEKSEDLLVFVRRAYFQFLGTIGMGLPAASYKAALTYDGEKTDVDVAQSF